MATLYGTQVLECAPVTADGSMPLEAARQNYARLIVTVSRFWMMIRKRLTNIQTSKTNLLKAFIAGKTKGKFSTYDYDPATLKINGRYCSRW